MINYSLPWYPPETITIARRPRKLFEIPTKTYIIGIDCDAPFQARFLIKTTHNGTFHNTSYLYFLETSLTEVIGLQKNFWFIEPFNED